MRTFSYFKSNFTFLILLFVFINNQSFSFSQSITYNFDWKEDSIYIQDKLIHVPKQFKFEFNSAKIYHKRKVTKYLSARFINAKFEALNESELNFIKQNGITVDSSLSFTSNSVNNQNELFFNFEFSAFVRRLDKIYKVISIEIEVSENKNFTAKKRNKISNSLLSDESSAWFRFRIKNKGFYKITYSQLKKLGVNPSEINFSSFHIYGNSTGKLPELNSDYEDLDLVQNAVIYQGNEDGVFNESDAIVFYSNGPNKLQLNDDSLLTRDLNIYSDYLSFFLRISSKVKPKLIQLNDNSSLNHNIDVYDYQFHSIHEIEDTSLVYAGKRWYGELLDYVRTLDVEFNDFQTELEDLTISISGATNARIYGSYLNLYVENQFISKISLPSVSSEFIRIQNKIKIGKNFGFKDVKIELIRNSPDTKFFLDKIEINAFKKLNIIKDYEIFSNSRVLGKGIVKFYIPNTVKGVIMDVSKPTEISGMVLNSENNIQFFKDSTNRLKFYTFYNYQKVQEIETEFIPIKSQNLHAVDLVDMIIVSPPEFLNQANELKFIHQNEGLRTIVVTDQEVYNEFSSGEMDPTAIKQFARSVYNKQRNSPSERLKYLLLFGDGTFDYKNRIKGNNNFIPTYQFDESEDFLSAMVSDDYFGMMDDNESLKGSDLLDIGVGRMLISNQKQANEMISKIKEYIKLNEGQTDWRSKIAMIADDEEGGYFINNDTEPQYFYLKEKHPEMNVVKLYSDAFQQVTTAGGERYPMLNTQIDNQFFNGSLVISYVGHGGPSGAAEERIISIDQVAGYKNKDKLPLFMSSTCEFTKFDDPTRVSAGEIMYLNPVGGAIALMTTTRPVFFGVNTISGSAFYKNVLQYDTLSNSSLTFGEIFRRTKNQSGTSSNRRSFTLIGDPALKISYPVNKIKIDSINGYEVKVFVDTIKALSKVNVSGHIEDNKGNKLNVDGSLFLTLYDKKGLSRTLGQNVSSPVIEFENQNSILFKGKATINNGFFNINFILPKDIDYSIGKGKFSVISYSESNNGIGFCDSFLLGGISSNFLKDSIGPDISISLDSTKEVLNGTFSKNSIFYIKLNDESGINVSSSGIGHQVSLIIDDRVNDAIDLNSFYVSDLDTYKSGKIQYPLPELTNGRHKARLKAWDVHNNSSEKEIHFSINNVDGLNLSRIFNYPNPFTTKTSFFVEQNAISSNTNIKLEIFTVSGKLVKEEVRENILLRSNIEKVVDWDGLDQYGDQLAKGVYLYKITISDNQRSLSKIEKLVIF